MLYYLYSLYYLFFKKYDLIRNKEEYSAIKAIREPTLEEENAFYNTVFKYIGMAILNTVIVACYIIVVSFMFKLGE